MLDGLEREYCKIAYGTDRFAVEACTQRMGAILDQCDAMAIGDVAQGVELRGVTRVVDDQNRLGLGPDAGTDRGRVEVAIAWVRDRPGVVAPIIGARTAAQLRGALAVEELDLPDEIFIALDEVSTPNRGYPEFGWNQR